MERMHDGLHNSEGANVDREKLEAYVSETFNVEKLDMKRVKAALDALEPADEVGGYDEHDSLIETLTELKDLVPADIDDSAVLELALALCNLRLATT